MSASAHNKRGIHPRPYDLYRRKRGERWWVRVERTGAYTKPTAIRVFQDRLIMGAFDPDWEWRLRPIE